MKILIVGSDKIYSIENYYVKHLSQRGISVSRFLAPNFFYDYYEKNFFSKFSFRAGFSRIYGSINKMFLEKVENEKPDVVWVFKGMELFPESLNKIRDKGIKLVNYNPDNPFLFSGRGSGNKNITDAIGLYDLHFTYNLSIKDKLENNLHLRTFFLPFGFEIDDSLYDHCTLEKEIIMPCFLGNPDSDRANFLTSVAKKGISLTVFGHGWKRFVSHPNIAIQDAVYGVEQWEILRRYRVQFNLMRVHNADSHNMRTFEVPAIGGIMLTPQTREQEMFFEHGREAFFFRNVDESIDRLQDILSLSAEQALIIRNSARNRSVLSGYSYGDRTNDVLKELDSLL